MGSPHREIQRKRVCVIVRCRPVSPGERRRGAESVLDIAERSIVVQDPVELAHGTPGARSQWSRAFAFDEVAFPSVLLLLPGVFLCVVGVFCIAHEREERHRKRNTTAVGATAVGASPQSERLRNKGTAAIWGATAR